MIDVQDKIVKVKIGTKLKRVISSSETVLCAIGALGVVAIAVVTIMGICRRALGYSSVGEGELVELLMALVVFFPLAKIQAEHGHITMELLFSRFKGRALYLAELFISVLWIVLCILLMWKGVPVLIHAFVRGETTPGVIAYLLYPFIACFIIGVLFLSIRAVWQLYQVIKGGVKK